MASEYDENWITTYTGKQFHYLNPSFDEIDIKDIAHALSLKCRFSGHTRTFYSVGQHSLHVADILPDKLKLSGLLHDATEAYMPDIPSPIKYKFKSFKKFEDNIANKIQLKFGVIHNKQIKEADNVILATEARDLMTNIDGWANLPKPLHKTIIPYQPEAVEAIFLMNFRWFGGTYERK